MDNFKMLLSSLSSSCRKSINSLMFLMVSWVKTGMLSGGLPLDDL
jgi:hypothetical protein